MASPTARVLDEQAFYSWTEWDSVDLVKGALRDLEFGVLDQAAQVVDAMGRDDRISGCTLTRVEALPALPFTMATPEGAAEGSKADAIAEEASELFERMCPNAELLKLHHWGVHLGLGIGQNRWEKTEGAWVPTLHVWHPRMARYDIDREKLLIQTRQGEMEIVPGDPRWVVYAPYGLKRGWMFGKVRSLYVPWLVRQWGWRDWARKSEVHGIAIRKAFTPTNADEKDKERFLKEVARLGRESVIRLPRPVNKDEGGFDLELLEAEVEGHLVFKDLLAETNSSIAITLIGQNLTTEVKGGAYAAAQVHQNIRADILRGDAQNLGLCLQAQVLGPWAKFNHGDAALAPLPTWSTDPPEDKAQAGTALKNLGDGLTALRHAGVKPDVDAIVKAHGVPVTGKAEEPEPEVDPADDPSADPGADDVPTTHSNHGNHRGPHREVSLASLPKAQRRAVVEGQLYLDEVVKEGQASATLTVGTLTAQLIHVVHQATSFQHLKQLLQELHESEDLTQLADLVEKCLILAELEGRNAVLEESE